MSTTKEILSYRFDGFLLDVSNRRLWSGEQALELSGRYFDALALLVREHGQLIGKERFFTEVWEDVIVSDSALTQCIKDIRKQLGDEASRPRYVETVPRYGYRFIAPVVIEPALTVQSAVAIKVPDLASEPSPEPTLIPPPVTPDLSSVELPTADERGVSTKQQVGTDPLMAFLPGVAKPLRWCIAGTLGGAAAGLLGGLFYGFLIAYLPEAPRLGTVSVLAVLLSFNVAMGLLGGFGVSCGTAVGSWIMRQDTPWNVAGAALGGLLIGAIVKILGTDAFHLLFGSAPAGITGGLEGALLGAAIVLGARLGTRVAPRSGRAPVVGAGVLGALSGLLIALSGGELMGGSLHRLGQAFSASQLRLDTLGAVFGELSFGFTTRLILTSFEAAVFAACVAGAIVLSGRGDRAGVSPG